MNIVSREYLCIDDHVERAHLQLAAHSPNRNVAEDFVVLRDDHSNLQIRQSIFSLKHKSNLIEFEIDLELHLLLHRLLLLLVLFLIFSRLSIVNLKGKWC